MIAASNVATLFHTCVWTFSLRDRICSRVAFDCHVRKKTPLSFGRYKKSPVDISTRLLHFFALETAITIASRNLGSCRTRASLIFTKTETACVSIATDVTRDLQRAHISPAASILNE